MRTTVIIIQGLKYLQIKKTLNFLAVFTFLLLVFNYNLVTFYFRCFCAALVSSSSCIRLIEYVVNRCILQKFMTHSMLSVSGALSLQKWTSSQAHNTLMTSSLPPSSGAHSVATSTSDLDFRETHAWKSSVRNMQSAMSVVRLGLIPHLAMHPMVNLSIFLCRV